MTRIGICLISLSPALLSFLGCAAPARPGNFNLFVDRAAEEPEDPKIEEVARHSGMSEADARELAKILEAMDENLRPMMTQVFLATLATRRQDSSAAATDADGTTAAEEAADWPKSSRRRRQPDADEDPLLTAAEIDRLVASKREQQKHEPAQTSTETDDTSSRRTSRASPATASLSDETETAAEPLAKGETVTVAGSASPEKELQGETASINDSPRTPAPAETIPDQAKHGSMTWQQSLQHTIRELEDRLVKETMSETERIRVQAHLGLLNIIAEDPEKAVNAFQDFDEEELEFWRQTTMALDALLAPNELPRRSHRVELATNHLRTGVKALATLGPLRVRNLAFCTKVSGFGDYREFESYSFPRGQQVLLYVEIEDFAVEQVESVTTTRSTGVFSTRQATHEVAGELTYKTELHARYEILDDDQHRIATKVLPVDRETCRNHRQDYYIPYLIYLPDNIEPGHYKLELVVEDKKGIGKVGFAAIDFQIQR